MFSMDFLFAIILQHFYRLILSSSDVYESLCIVIVDMISSMSEFIIRNRIY